MTAAVLIRELDDAGIRLSRNGDRLHIEAPKGALTDELKAKLVDAKPALLVALDAREPDLADIRARLLRIADGEGVDAALILRQPEDEVAVCVDFDDDVLTAYVRALRDTDLRERGKVPLDETAPAICAGCGPIWLHPAVAKVAPVVLGWPRVLGCPWCSVRNRVTMPRPKIACGDCRHFQRNAVNSSQGAGLCRAGRDPIRPWPTAPHECGEYMP